MSTSPVADLCHVDFPCYSSTQPVKNNENLRRQASNMNVANSRTLSIYLLYKFYGKTFTNQRHKLFVLMYTRTCTLHELYH